MNNIPQNVSRRYVRNFIADGVNSTFELDHIIQRIAMTPGGLPCGAYFVAGVKCPGEFYEQKEAEGATPEAAVASTLRAFGVTFA